MAFEESSLFRDDPYSTLRNLFITFFCHEITKIILKFCLVFYLSLWALEIHYLFTHFTVETVVTYGVDISLTLFFNCILLISVLDGKFILNVLEDMSFFWPIDIAGPHVRHLILERTGKINKCNFIFLTFFVSNGALVWPLSKYTDFGEFLLSVRVCELWFGTWSKIPYCIYVISMPFLMLSCIRLCQLLLFLILEFEVQFILLNHKIEQISVDCEHDLGFQNEIYERLHFCVSHHVALKMWIKRVVAKGEFLMPVIIFLGTLGSTAVFSYILYKYDDMSIITKISFISGTLCYTFIGGTLAVAGQLLSDETSRLFNQLYFCPWYLWNTKNRRALLISMANSLEPVEFTMFEITLNYRFVLSMFKAGYSYGMVVYNLK